VLSFFPGNRFPKVEITRIDLAVHFFFYSVLTFLLVASHTNESKQTWWGKNPVFSAFLLSISYGILIEILQGTVFVNRSADPIDVVANTIGAILGWFVYTRIHKNPKFSDLWNQKRTSKRTTEIDPPNSLPSD
jgi:VanZ family protein